MGISGRTPLLTRPPAKIVAARAWVEGSDSQNIGVIGRPFRDRHFAELGVGRRQENPVLPTVHQCIPRVTVEVNRSARASRAEVELRGLWRHLRPATGRKCRRHCWDCFHQLGQLLFDVTLKDVRRRGACPILPTEHRMRVDAQTMGEHALARTTMMMLLSTTAAATI